MTCEYKEHAALRTVEIIINGKVTEEDFDNITSKMEAFIKAHGKIKIIEIIKDLSGFELTTLGKGIKFDIEHLKDFTHCAVVSNHGWIGPFARMMSPFFSIEIKTFNLDEEQQARDWLETA